MSADTFICPESQPDRSIPPLKPGERLLSVDDIANMTGRHPETVRRWLRSKRRPLQYYRPGGSGTYLVHPDQLAKFLNSPRPAAEISPRLSSKLDTAIRRMR